jgi:carboxypeptidase Taq
MKPQRRDVLKMMTAAPALGQTTPQGGREKPNVAVIMADQHRAGLTRAGSLGYQAWLRAREQEDYGIMLPHLERNLELRLRYVACFDHDGDPYDVVLDDYEPGMKTVEVEHIFEKLKARLTPMMRELAAADPIDDSCLRGRFPRGAQRRFALGMLERWGMDRAAWRLDKYLVDLHWCRLEETPHDGQ